MKFITLPASAAMAFKPRCKQMVGKNDITPYKCIFMATIEGIFDTCQIFIMK